MTDARDIIATRLMYLRRGNPSMSGPSPTDWRRADDLIAELEWRGFAIVRTAAKEEA